MAVIFRDWSIELVVEGEEHMCSDLRRVAWEKSRRVAQRHLKNGMEHYMTMQLKKGLIPVKIVKRGSERVY